MRLALLITVALTGSIGCDASSVDLGVDLRTDLVAGREVARVETFVDGAQVDDVTADVGLLEGARVAFVSDLTASPTRTVRVVLRSATGEQVAERSALVDNSSSRIVTLVITRACRGVTCGDAQTCVDGTCRDQRCLEGDEIECGEPECTSVADCAGGVACASADCRAGVCLYGPGACGVSEFCDLDVGCLPEAPSDAGVDAGGTDAGVDAGADAGMDAGADAGTDAGADAGTDAAPPAPADAGPDAWTPPPGMCRDCDGSCSCDLDETCCLGCPAAGRCSGICSASRCVAEWPGVGPSDLVCSDASCLLDLSTAESVRVTCVMGAECLVQASLSTDVEVVCDATSECEVLCAGATGCRFVACGHGVAQDCGGGRFICSAGGC